MAGVVDAYSTTPTYGFSGNKGNQQNYFQAGPQAPAPKPPSPLTGAYNTANAATSTQAADYSGIMDMYRQLFGASNSGSQIASQFHPVTPQTVSAPSAYQAQVFNYQPSKDVTSSLSTLKGLAETGGLSDAEQGDLRARGVSPIRAVYANAQSNLNRQKALQGGYSPGYTAASSKLARGLSSQLSDQVSNVNAQIAEMVQRGKLSAAPQYASAAGSENSQRTQAGEFNAGQQNDASRFNAGAVNETNLANANATNEANRFNSVTPLTLQLQGTQADIENRLRSLSGMTSLYGTTPALVRTFGDQAMNAAQLQNQITQQNNSSGNAQLDAILRSIRG